MIIQNPIREARSRLEATIEQAIATLDAMDGDPDLELTSEDEGAQCDDEGAIDYQQVATYADDGHGGEDQRHLANTFVGVDVSPLGVR